MNRHLKTLFAGTLCIAATFVASAREYNSQVLFNLQGPVKERVIDSQSELTNICKKVKFEQNGRMSMDMLTYNEQGYPIGFGMNWGNDMVTVSIDYNDKKLPVEIKLQATAPKKIDVTIRNTYDGDRIVSREVTSVEGGRFLYEYSGEVLDDNGNWTTRNVREIIIDPESPEPQTKEYTERQELTYY